MNKETALNILNIEENELSTEEIDNRFNELKKIYDPEYKSNNMYDIISHKPDAKKYEQIVSAKAFLNVYVNKEKNEETLESLLPNTNILTVRAQNKNESLNDYIKYIKDYYEKIIVEEVKKSTSLSKELSELKSKKEEITSSPKTTPIVSESLIDEAINAIEKENNLYNANISESSVKSPEVNKPSIDFETNIIAETNALINNEKSLNNINPEEKISEQPEEEFNMDSYLNGKYDEELSAASKQEENHELNNLSIQNIIGKIKSGTEYSNIKENISKFTPKGIQVTKTFISKLRSADYKYLLVSTGQKITHLPSNFINNMVGKLNPKYIKNREIIEKNITSLTDQEKDLLTEEYEKNGLTNFDEKIAKYIESAIKSSMKETQPEDKNISPVANNDATSVIPHDEVLIPQNNAELSPEEELKEAKASIAYDYERINKIKAMSDALVDNEPQKEVYNKLINDLLNNKAEEVKKIHDLENKISNKDDKSSFIESFLNKFKGNDKDAQIEKLTTKIKDLETKAIAAGNNEEALKTYMQIEDMKNSLEENNKEQKSL